MRPLHAVIDLDAWCHNLAHVRSISPAAKVLAVVKANGYGHGMLAAAQALSNADAFGVTSIDEAIELRQSGVSKEIMVLEGAFDAGDWQLACEYHVGMAVHCHEQVNWLEDNAITTPVRIWLKCDTGMHRLGFSPTEIAGIASRLERSERVLKPVGLMSHFASSDTPTERINQQQLMVFNRLAARKEVPRSMANSGAILHNPHAHFDWIRPGIMLYGISPSENMAAVDIGLKPVMTLKSKVIAVRRVAEGDGVGYGLTWQAKTTALIATIAVGYGDGYPRHAPSGTPVLINDQKYPLVGRVSMDMITVDVSSAKPAIKVGDDVVLWGAGLPIEQIASAAGTIGYELVCQVTPRVKRISINSAV